MISHLLLTAVLVATSAPEDASRRAADAFRSQPRMVRCDLVKALFAPDVFDELRRYFTTGCGRDCAIGDRISVRSEVGSTEGAGLFPVDPLFSDGEACEGQGFLLWRATAPSTATHPDWIVQLMILPRTKSAASFGVSVTSHPDAKHHVGIRGCTFVVGQVVRTRGRWKVSPKPPEVGPWN